MSVDLKRYLDASKRDYVVAYTQTLNKVYDSGWVSYIFPRKIEDCDSERSKPYGLKDMKEARAFWKTKLLRENYMHMLSAIDKMTKDEFDSVFTKRAREKIKLSLDVFIDVSKDLSFFDNYDSICSFVKKFYGSSIMCNEISDESPNMKGE